MTLKKVSVLCSGGMDSVLLAAQAKKDPLVELVSLVHIVTQTPAGEVERRYVAEWGHSGRFNVPVVEINPGLDIKMSERNWRLEDTPCPNVVIGRNLAFIALAINRQGHRVDEIWVGATKDDHADYPDCRPAFFNALDSLAQAAYGVGVKAPFIEETKLQVLTRMAGSWLADVEVSALCHSSWSCYFPTKKTFVWDDVQHWLAPCETCHSCQARETALKAWSVLADISVDLHPKFGRIMEEST